MKKLLLLFVVLFNMSGFAAPKLDKVRVGFVGVGARGSGAVQRMSYIDGVEIPNINHFATQGSSGGPVGLINVDFIRKK